MRAARRSGGRRRPHRHRPRDAARRQHRLALAERGEVEFEGRVGDATLVVRRNGTKVSRGDGTLADRNRRVRARLRSTRSGRYAATVRWLSSDGHVLSKTWSFRVR